MITIDFVDEHANQSVKMTVRRHQVLRIPEVAMYDPMMQLANSQQNALLEAAHTQRMLKAAQQGSPAVDVQRLYEGPKATLFTLIERYLLRSR